jgi:hypothetical protein
VWKNAVGATLAPQGGTPMPSRYNEDRNPAPAAPAAADWTVWTLGILIALTLAGWLLPPRFIHGHQHSPAKSCVANLAQINSAVEQWAMDHKSHPGATVPMTLLVGSSAYIKSTPTCPSGGRYGPLVVGINPTCSIGTKGDRDPRNDHTLP